MKHGGGVGVESTHKTVANHQEPDEAEDGSVVVSWLVEFERGQQVIQCCVASET